MKRLERKNSMEKMTTPEFWNVVSDDVAASTATAPGMETIQADFQMVRIVKLIPDVPFKMCIRDR